MDTIGKICSMLFLEDEKSEASSEPMTEDIGYASLESEHVTAIPDFTEIHSGGSSRDLTLTIPNPCSPSDADNGTAKEMYVHSVIGERQVLTPVQETHTEADYFDHARGPDIHHSSCKTDSAEEGRDQRSQKSVEVRQESQQPTQESMEGDGVDRGKPERSELGRSISQPCQSDLQQSTSDLTLGQLQPIGETTQKRPPVNPKLTRDNELDSAAIIITSQLHHNGRDQLTQNVAEIIASKVNTYTTELSRNTEKFVKDSNTGVIAIHPDDEKIASLNLPPTTDRLFEHKSLYPHLSSINNVSTVMAYSDSNLSELASELKSSIFSRAKVLLFNVSIPEDNGDIRGEWKALEYAAYADVIFSVGPQVYHHFENKYRGIFSKDVLHFCYLPQTNNDFLDLNMTKPGCKKQVLTMAEVKNKEDFENYSHVAMAMGKVADMYNNLSRTPLVWNIMGVETSLSETFRQFLIKTASSKYLRIIVQSRKSQNDFRISILQSCLYIAPERIDHFNFHAYLAMQAGIPVLVASCTGIVAFLDELFGGKGHAEFVSVDTALTNGWLEEDSERWKQAILDKLTERKIDVSFKKAKMLQKDLRNCEEIKLSKQEFLENFRKNG
ncbi:uncharacterized protein [Ptychodera flava]|uniref:uncharacterized protein n=1 Tax=Ptychodera flava TaxID=63121 RepID=UPI00396A63CD